MASFVPFLEYFMLSWRDHIQPTFLQLFEGPGRILAATSLDGIASVVRAFVVGNFLLGLLLAVASTAFFRVFRLPYPILIGPLSGFLSLVPSVGVPLAVVEQTGGEMEQPFEGLFRFARVFSLDGIGARCRGINLRTRRGRVGAKIQRVPRFQLGGFQESCSGSS